MIHTHHFNHADLLHPVILWNILRHLYFRWAMTRPSHPTKSFQIFHLAPSYQLETITLPPPQMFTSTCTYTHTHTQEKNTQWYVLPFFCIFGNTYLDSIIMISPLDAAVIGSGHWFLLHFMTRIVDFGRRRASFWYHSRSLHEDVSLCGDITGHP